MEREPVTRERVVRFLRELGKRYRGGGRLYLVGGTQMVFTGFRGQTEDIDYTVRLEGDHQEFTAAVRSLIRELNISVEPAWPGDFIPLPRGWEERSRFIGRYGQLDGPGQNRTRGQPRHQRRSDAAPPWDGQYLRAANGVRRDRTAIGDGISPG